LTLSLFSSILNIVGKKYGDKKMEVITHTVFAAVCMGACYFWGRYLSKDEILEGVVGTMLDRLEKDGFIRTVEGKNGDMELVPISEIIEENR
jgi:hypothetical protein|tara:strand:- start:823 stop:1098 length:276 start_codon:yes stop_codon:yes gene_type:complete